MKKTYIYIGVLVIVLVAAGVYLDLSGEKMDINQNNFEKQSETLTLEPLGEAPEFTGIDNWLNSEPLSMSGLKGRVVLVDFWTYSCINCIRTLPYITDWHRKYADQGLVIVGVHTPEFEFEKVTGNVQTALDRHNIEYPVAQDNSYATWRAWSNRYWPAKYLVNQDGQVVYYHFGEGKYGETETAIRTLLGLEGSGNTEVNTETRGEVGTPEIYFGLLRLDNFASDKPSQGVGSFTLPKNLSENEFALEGQWEFTGEYARLVGSNGKIQLNYYASKVYMVAESSLGVGSKLKIYIDGQLHNEVEVTDSKLYNLVDLPQAGEHVLQIEVEGSGFSAFTFTFG